MTKRHSAVVAGVTLMLAMTACSSSGEGPDTAATNGGFAAPVTGDAAKGDSPAARLKAALQAQERGDYVRACTYVNPEDIKKLEAEGRTTCVRGLKESSKEEKYSDIEVDASQVKIEGDKATVPRSAVRYKINGKPADETFDVNMVRRNGQWFIDQS